MPSPTKIISKSDTRAIDGLPGAHSGHLPDGHFEDACPDGAVLFEALFDHAAAGAAVATPEGCLARVNPALCEMLGYAPQELLDRRLQRIMTANHWQQLSGTFKELCSGKKARAQVPIDCLHQSGRHIRALLDLCRVAGPDGRARAIVVQLHDISRQADTEPEPAEKRQRYQALSETTFEAVLLLREGICIDANRTASLMFGMPCEKLLGRSATDIIAPEYQALVKRTLLSAKATPLHAVAVKSDGTRFHVMINSRMVRIGDSDVRMTVIHDIDDQVKIEAALRESERHLRSLMESASSFVLFRLRHNPENPCLPRVIFVSPSIKEIVDTSKVFDFQSWLKMIHPDDMDGLVTAARKMIEIHRMDQTARILGPADKGWRWMHIIAVAVTDDVDRSLFFNGIIWDITGEMNAEAALKARECELNERTESLSEVNTALEVLLRKREADRMEVEEKMLGNAKRLILPYLEKLKASRLDDRQRVYLNLVESNLNELISPLSQRMVRQYINFTPLEIQVANLVKEGKTTKDIAAILGLSIRTIEAVRYTIRRKLGLKKKRANLRSHLLSIDGSDTIPHRNGWSR